jgi:hypothetical protein
LTPLVIHLDQVVVTAMTITSTRMAVRQAGLSEDECIVQFCAQHLYLALVNKEGWAEIFNEFGH